MKTWLKVTFMAGAGLLAACSQQSADHAITNQHATPLAVTQARAQTLTTSVTLPASVTRERRARLASMYGGLVTATPVTAGSRVKRGELLLAVGASDAQARLAAAKAEAASSRADAEQAAADEHRFSALLSEGAAAPREYEQVHRRYVAAQARARAAKQALSAARSNLQYAEIRAPFDGLLAERRVKPGDYAAPGMTVALVVGGAAEVELEAGEAVYPQLQLNATLRVSVKDQHYQGTVVERVDAADPATRTHKVKLRLAGDMQPPYGAYAEVRVPTGSRPAVVVPASAVIVRAGITGVFSVNQDGVAQFRPVRTAGTDNGLAQIASGLDAGERVVTTPPLALGNGTRVSATHD